MKTAISIPDDVFERADAVSRRTGVSRSRLFTEAMRLYLDTHGDRGVTDRLNEVYREVGSTIDPAWLRAQSAALDSEETW